LVGVGSEITIHRQSGMGVSQGLVGVLNVMRKRIRR